jgi:integrase
VRGLQVRKDARGHVSYRLRFRIKGRPQVLTATFTGGLAEAREHARDYQALARIGRDPRPAKPLAPLTLTRCAALWVRANRRRWRRSTTKFYLALLRRRVLDAFGDRDPREIARGELRLHLDRIAARHPIEANRTYATLRALYSWLNKARQEWVGVSVDPTRGLEHPAPEVPRSTTYTDAQLRQLVAEGSPLVRFLALTGVRDGEARGLSWSEVDFERRVWTIPAERSKSRRQRQVPLSHAAAKVLVDVRGTFAARPWVKTRPTKVYSAMGLRPHDLRRSLGDRIKAEFGEARMHAVLGHTDAALTRTYGPSPRLEAQREALEWWAGELGRIAGRGGKGRPARRG